MARILLVRHGEAAYEADVINDEGGCLTPSGREQSRGLARQLADERVDRIWTSPMSRAVQTAEITAAGLRLGEVTVREDLREYAVGAWGGRSESNYALMSELFDRWLAGDRTTRIPDGEVIEEFADRLAVVLEEAADAVAEGRTAVVITHGGAIGAVVTQLVRDLPRLFAKGRHLPNCESVELVRDSGEWRMLRWGSVGSVR